MSCWCGVNGLLKHVGIDVGIKLANEIIKKISGEILTKINQKVVFWFITKFGTKGIINLSKMLLGIGDGLDLIETKIIADCVYQWFMIVNFSMKDENCNIIEVG